MRPRYRSSPPKWCGITVTRAWRCGNRGNVASALIEKPARGDFLPILDGGFSLQYSPLMDYREGKGMVLFCQMDVTGRTGARPGRARLVANILNYAASYSAPPARKARLRRQEAGRKHLEQLGLTPGRLRGRRPGRRRRARGRAGRRPRSAARCRGP